MTLVVPKYRVLLDDTDSVKDPLAHGLMQIVEPQNARTWDLLPFRDNVRQLHFQRSNRTISAREVVLENAILTGDTDVDLRSGTKARVTSGHILYHPATKQRFVLNVMTQSTGTATLEAVLQAPGGSRTQVDAGQTLYILSQAEDYETISATSRFEETNIVDNYVQDMTERLDWSVADLREARKWGVDQKKMLKERMRDIMKDLNNSILFNVPQAHDASHRAITAGFDYIVENAGSIVDAAESGTADLADIKGVLKQLQKNGVGPSDGIFALMSIDAFHAYQDQGLAEMSLAGTPGEGFVVGKIIQGVRVPGLDFVPFYTDPFLVDDRVRFISSANAGKAFYQGESGPVESPTMHDEDSLSNSKVKVSTMQQKWTTIFDNPDTCHYILDNTGL